MARKKVVYCEWCMTKVKPPAEVCARHADEFAAFQRAMAPARAQAAKVGVRIKENAGKVEKLKAAAEEAERLAREAQDEVDAWNSDISQELAEALGIDYVALGNYACKHSPTGKCFYDDDTDPGYDSCLMCGNPSERK